jgi:hypothetical protein
VKIRPAGTTENPKVRIIWCGSYKAMKRGVIGYAFGWSPIYEVGGYEEGLVPIFEWHGGSS